MTADDRVREFQKFLTTFPSIYPFLFLFFGTPTLVGGLILIPIGMLFHLYRFWHAVVLAPLGVLPTVIFLNSEIAILNFGGTLVMGSLFAAVVGAAFWWITFRYLAPTRSTNGKIDIS